MQRQEKQYDLTYALKQALNSNDAAKLQKELSQKRYLKKPELLNLTLAHISNLWESPLLTCAYNGRNHSFRHLLERSDINLHQSYQGWQALHYLAYRLVNFPGEKIATLEMLSLLLKDKRFEFNVNMTTSPVVVWAFKNLSEATRCKLLTICFNSEITAELDGSNVYRLNFTIANATLFSMLASEPDFPINTVLHTGETLLMQCILDDNTEAALLALQRADININLPNANGDTPLTLAAKLGRSAVVTALLERKDVNLHHQIKDNHTPITLAFLHGHAEMGYAMLQHPNFEPKHLYKSETNIAILAASCQAYSLLEYVLNLKILDVNARDANGNTAFMHNVIASDNARILNLLFRYGANPHIENNEEYTPYMKARQKKREGIRPLLKKMMQEFPNKVVVQGTSFTPAKELHDLVARIESTPKI